MSDLDPRPLPGEDYQEPDEPAESTTEADAADQAAEVEVDDDDYR